ncbi:MAG: glycosyl transferase, partial [Pseudomonadota bacterium]|nr:glycosyl transferase [Pseudomonadota bacterium]
MPWTTVAAITFVLSLLATRLGIVYAMRRRLLDLPGRRRSHATPTPRGGGIGIIVGIVFSLISFTGWSRV